ncbi:hypothetical protein OS190_13245 [Sulfitobacter sp. F26204]|uniref:acyl-homoserine-lactone synthase n=1 Tax=Sulfitobacter sp. F26204 TaxID=2996014 RepID=UPI00225E463D|nr:acyl-homoserine-lactone synthase [Sulfitobacter sp. F26204]MCX7560536.1 hypothetical protein [Sulfitobacter sp. F26204]
MFTTIQPHQTAQNRDLLIKAMKLRKQVFADQLKWNVPVQDDMEYDIYDMMGASYVVWCSEDRETMYGMVRLMVTTGPTLLHDVFHATHDSSTDLIADDVWEGTRMCINETAIQRDFGLDASQAFNRLFLGLAEAANALGIRKLVSNFEACMSRIYRRAGLRYDLHGKADGYGEKPVFCASFEVTPAVIAQMQQKIGIPFPLFRQPEGFLRAVGIDQPRSPRLAA